jgi:serine/threonine protein kinase/WD40 repeat protein
MTDSLSKFEPVERLAEEFLARYRRGERPALSEYTREHPEVAELIREYFPAMVLMEKLGSGVGDESGAALADSGPLGLGTLPEHLGEYRILKEKGRGGMGIVFEALQETLGRHVALKVLPFHALLNQTQRKRFRREAQAAARLHHTNIVPVYGVGECDGVHYYAMQLVQGQTLDEVLREVRRLRAEKEGSPGAGPVPQTASAGLVIGLLSGQFAGRPPRGEDATIDESKRSEHSSPSQVGASGVRGSSRDASTSLSAIQSELTAQGNGLYFRSVAQIGLQVAEALDYAHHEGILHRDIKPSNLLLDTFGRVWITDFGLAKAEGWEELTSPGDVVGTVRYMAPERFGDRADARSDVYGLGIALYEMLTLRAAFEDSNRARLMERVAHEEPPRPRTIDRQIPRDLETIVLKATAKEPAERYLSAAVLADDLRRFLADRPVRARRTPLGERAWRWCRRNPAVAGLTAAIVLLLLVLAGSALLNNARLARALGASDAANLEAKEKLWVSLRDRARAVLMSRHAGQRVDSLRSIAEALQLPLPRGHSRDELRTAAIAALALPDLELLQEWAGFPAGSRDLAFDANLERYARLSASGAISVRRVVDDAEIAHWQESTTAWPAQESYLRFSPDGQFLCTRHAASGRLTVRRLDTQEPPVCFEGTNPAAEWVMDFSPDSKRLVYLMADSRIGIVDLSSGQVRFLPATGAVHDHVRFAPDGRRFALAAHRAGQWDIECRDAATGQLQQRLPHPQHAYHPAWHPNGQILATCCDDCVIRLWHVASGRLLRELRGHKTLGINCTFTSTGDRLLSNDWGALLRLWEPSSGRQLLSRPISGYSLLQVSRDDRVPAIRVGDITKVQLLRLHAGREYCTIGPGGYVGAGVSDYCPVAVHHEGRLLAARAADASLLLVDLDAGGEVGRMAAGPRVTPLRWEPRTGELVTYGVQGLLHWPSRANPATGRYRLGPPKRLLAGDFWDGRLASSSDGQTIAIPGRGSGALVLDLKKPAAATDWVSGAVRLGPQHDVRWCAVSPDGRWVATGSHADTAGFAAKVWNAATGELVKEFAVPGFCTVTFSPDGRWLLTTGGGCRLWRVGSWREGPMIGGASGCFSPDGQLVAVEDSAGAVRLVRPETGFELARLEAPEQTRLQPAAFSPDGTRLIAVGIDTQALHVWDLGRLREQLAAIDLDWDAPDYAAADWASTPNERRRPSLPIELEFAPPAPSGCSEAENLRIVERTDCEPIVQPMDPWDRRQWSNGRQLFCHSRRGTSVTLEIDVPEAGEYHLDIYFTMAPDYGVLEVFVDGRQVGNRFDGFCREVAPSGGIALGAAQLIRGKHRIRFRVLDKNPASTNYHMGIDCLELKPVKHQGRTIGDSPRPDPSRLAAASSQ